jgi:hypothetical protein
MVFSAGRTAVSNWASSRPPNTGMRRSEIMRSMGGWNRAAMVRLSCGYGTGKPGYVGYMMATKPRRPYHAVVACKSRLSGGK